MSRPLSPSMPTERQVKEAYEIVSALFPAARIKSVGPDGVEFDYPDQITPHSEWHGKPFGTGVK